MAEDNLRKEVKFDKDRWVIPYTNLITIIMILFMILYVFANVGSRASYERMLATIESSLGKEKRADLALLDLAEKLDGHIADRGLQQLVRLEVLPDRIRIALLAPIMFASGSAELKPSQIVEELRSMLKELPNNVVVEGHTDNLPVSRRSQYRSNLELSGARAFSLLRYMLDGGLPPERFRAIGVGENVPLVENDTEENRMLNRRVEIHIMRG